MAPGAINRNAVSPPAQGWRFGYPRIADEESFNRKAVASCSQRIRAGRNRQAVGINELSTQGSRSGNPGLKAATALRFGTSYAGINNVKALRLRSSATNLVLSLC